MSSKPRIKISRTEKEIIALEFIVMGRYNIDLKTYLRREIRKLTSAFIESPNKITAASGGNKKSIIHYFEGTEQHDVLKQLSFLMEKPISSIIDDFFIVPLLVPPLAK